MNPALVLTSHGTHDPAGREVVRRLAAAVRRAAAPFDVLEAVVDVEAHRLPTVLAAQRRPVVVLPLLLSSGHHVRHDVATAVADHPHAAATAPLGPSWTLAEVGAQRLAESGARPDDVVVLGGSGSSRPEALEDVEHAATLLRAVWGGDVRVGHLGRHGTPVADVVAQARSGGRRVVISSYVLAPGHFQGQLEGAGADLVTAPLLSPSPQHAIVDLLVRRFERAARTAGLWATDTLGPWST